jgi:HEPN domain-containing protein
LSRRDNRDWGRVLAKKAEGDVKAMRRLSSDPEIGDDVVGFHAQQAIEKWLKAVVVSHDLEFERSHDFGQLLDILDGAGIEAPPGTDWFDELSIYAVLMRYDEPYDVEPLDRDAVLSLVSAVGSWAAGAREE